MKKMIVLSLLTLATTTYSRDYENNERRDVVMEVNQYEVDRSGIENCGVWHSYIDGKFHIEIANQSRGHEDR